MDKLKNGLSTIVAGLVGAIGSAFCLWMLIAPNMVTANELDRALDSERRLSAQTHKMVQGLLEDTRTNVQSLEDISIKLQGACERHETLLASLKEQLAKLD